MISFTLGLLFSLVILSQPVLALEKAEPGKIKERRPQLLVYMNILPQNKIRESTLQNLNLRITGDNFNAKLYSSDAVTIEGRDDVRLGVNLPKSAYSKNLILKTSFIYNGKLTCNLKGEKPITIKQDERIIVYWNIDASKCKGTMEFENVTS